MIQVKNKKTYDGPGVYIGRPSPLGNPYSHLRKSKADIVVASRAEAVERYEEWLTNKLADENDPATKEFIRLRDEYNKTGELTLICWCAPAACHGHVISKMIQDRVDG